MDNIEKAIDMLKSCHNWDCEDEWALDMAISALEKQIPKKVYHFLDTDTFETTCCGIDVTNEDFDYCPNCGCMLGNVEEVEE